MKLLQKLLIFFLLLRLLCCSGDLSAAKDGPECLPEIDLHFSSTSQIFLRQRHRDSDQSIPDDFVHFEHVHSSPSEWQKRKKRKKRKSPVSGESLEHPNNNGSGLQTEPTCKIPRPPPEFVCLLQQRIFPKRIMMTLGPYVQFPVSAEDVKRKCLNHILELPGYKEEDKRKYWQELQAIRPMLRACYTSEHDMDDDTLMQTLFLDASCIYCILCLQFNPKPEDKVESLVHDFLHLKSQIPFEVVEIINFISKRYEDKATAAEDLGLQTALSFKYFLRQMIDEMAYNKSNLPKKFCHLLHLSQLLLKPSELSGLKKEKGKLVKGFYKAKYYYDQGVTFKVKKLLPGSARTILDVAFSWGGILHIPQLIVDKKIFCTLRNVVAFEQGGIGGYHVSEYAEFLKSLVQDKEDVELLVSKGILIRYNAQTNTDVADMINKLGGLVPSESEETYLVPVYESLDEYCCSWKWFIWRWSVLFWRKVKNLAYEPWFIFSLTVTVILGLASIFKK